MDQPKPIIMQTGFGPSSEILDDHEMGGVQVTAQSRAALMAKLARYIYACVCFAETARACLLGHVL
jgi:hypothetical protein